MHELFGRWPRWISSTCVCSDCIVSRFWFRSFAVCSTLIDLQCLLLFMMRLNPTHLRCGQWMTNEMTICVWISVAFYKNNIYVPLTSLHFSRPMTLAHISPPTPSSKYVFVQTEKVLKNRIRLLIEFVILLIKKCDASGILQFIKFNGTPYLRRA